MTSSLSNRTSNHQVEYAGEGELWLNEKCLINYNQDIVRHLTRPFQPRDHILDFGAGLGTMALIAQTHGFTPDCMEINDRMRAEATTLARQAYYHLQTAYVGCERERSEALVASLQDVASLRESGVGIIQTLLHRIAVHVERNELNRALQLLRPIIKAEDRMTLKSTMQNEPLGILCNFKPMREHVIPGNGENHPRLHNS
jgi:hypothetical protein